MALNKTTAELKVVETALPEKVAQKAGQVILSDDGKFFYDNTVKGRTRINPDGLKLVDTSLVNANSVVTPFTSICCNTTPRILLLETSYNDDGWLATVTPEAVSINSKYYCYIPKTGDIRDKFWEMLEGDNVFIQPTSNVAGNDAFYASFIIQLIYNGDGTPSAAETLSGTLIRYPAPSDQSDSYFNLALRVTDYDDSASNAQAIFESGYTFNTLRVLVRILDTNGTYVTWTGTNLQAIHGSQESANSPITFAAPIQIRNPETGEIENIKTQEGGYVKFLGFNTVDGALDIFDTGAEGIIQSTETTDFDLVYTSFPFEPTWVAGNVIDASSVTLALPLPRKLLLNASAICFCKEGQLGSEWAHGHITEFIEDCGSFCIVEVEWDNVGELSLPINATESGINSIEVEYTVSVNAGEAMWYHTNEYGVQFVEVITQSVILDEVDEGDDRPVRSSGIAKYIRDNVAGVYKFKGSLSPDLAYDIQCNPGTHEISTGYVYNVTEDGSWLTSDIILSAVLVSYTDTTFTFDCVVPEGHAVDTEIWKSVYIQSGDACYYGNCISIENITAPLDDERQTVTIIVEIYDDTSYPSTAEIAANFQYLGLGPYDLMEVKAGDNIVWNGNHWDKLAGTIDLSGYATKEEVKSLKTDLTNVLKYKGTVRCSGGEQLTTDSLKIGDVYNVYYSEGTGELVNADVGFGTIAISNSDIILTVGEDGVATLSGTDIQTAPGHYTESANYLRMDVSIVSEGSYSADVYHYVIVPTADKFSGYEVYDYYDVTSIPAAGTYKVVEISMYIDEEDNGVNVVWDGVGFDKLGHTVDLSKYVAVRDIESTVSASSNNPVSSKAVDAAIKSAVSSVYRFRGGTTIDDFEVSCRNSVTGDVLNLLQSGTITFYEPEQVPLMCTSFVSGGELQAHFNYLYDWITVSHILDVSIDGDSGFTVSSVYEMSGYYTMVSISPKDGYEFIDGTDYSITATIAIPDMEVKEGDNIVKAEVGWDKLSSTIDLSPYATVEQLNNVKADISHVYRYKGSIGSTSLTNYDTWIDSIPEIGDVYNIPTGSDAIAIDVMDLGCSVTVEGGIATLYSNYPVFTVSDGVVDPCINTMWELRPSDLSTSYRASIQFVREGESGSFYWYNNKVQLTETPYSEELPPDGNYILTTIHIDINVNSGANIVWNGWTFETLGGFVDLTPYQLKSGVTSKVASGNTNPVQSGAVYDAIRAAVSSVYKPIGSYTVDFINENFTNISMMTMEGSVINVIDSGTIEGSLAQEVSATYIGIDEDAGYWMFTHELLSNVEPEISGVQYFNNTTGDYYAIGSENIIIRTSGEMPEALTLLFIDFGTSAVSTPSEGDDISLRYMGKSLEVVAGDNIVATQHGWDKLAGTVDLTGYQTKLEFASEITSENASKPVTAGPVKSYVDSEIAKFLESSGSILNLVGSGQATLLHEYTFAEDATFGAGAVFYTASLSSPVYKMMIPAVAFPAGAKLLINGGEVEVPLMDSSGAITVGETVFTIEILPDGSVTLMTLNSANASLMPIIIGKASTPQVDTITLATDTLVTIAAGTTFKVFGWPTVQESDTATSINAMLKEIYDTQEAFKAQTSIPDSDNGVDSYTSVADLPAAANSGAVAAVTSDSDTTARGMYMFINGKWQRLAFAGESLVDGDTVEVTIE